jgi:hypothetical protein|tara:strand:+ start:290 stop:520 length:231 start_codon:yes stop_codon:yes gene_type:complete
MSNKWKNKTEEEIIDYFESFENKSKDMLNTISNILYFKNDIKKSGVNDNHIEWRKHMFSLYKAELADLIKQKKGVK